MPSQCSRSLVEKIRCSIARTSVNCVCTGDSNLTDFVSSDFGKPQMCHASDGDGDATSPIDSGSRAHGVVDGSRRAGARDGGDNECCNDKLSDSAILQNVAVNAGVFDRDTDGIWHASH